MLAFNLFLLFYSGYVVADTFITPERGFAPHLQTCGAFGKFEISACGWYSWKVTWNSIKLLFSSPDYSNSTIDDITQFCDRRYTCLQNTGCYLEHVNIRELDRYSYSAFILGPFATCEDKLREMMKNNTETQKMSYCVKEYLLSSDPEPNDCELLTKRIECFSPEVQKFCSPHIYELHQQIQQKRLKYKECVKEETQ